MSSNLFPMSVSKSNLKEKHVTFAQNPIVYKSIPWKIDYNYIETQLYHDQSLDPNETDLSLSFMPLSRFPENTNFKTFKFPYHVNKEPTDIVGLLIIIICLISLFVMIWWIADKLLILEIEKQVSNSPIGNSNGNANIFQKR